MAVQGELSPLGAWREIKVLLMQQITEPDIQCSAYTKSKVSTKDQLWETWWPYIPDNLYYTSNRCHPYPVGANFMRLHAVLTV